MNWKPTVAALCGAFVIFAMSGSRAVYAAPPTDACRLLSAEQVSAVLGIKVGEGKPASPSNNKLCQWDASALVGTARKGVALALQSPSQAFSDAAAPGGHRIVNTPARQSAKIPADGFRGDAYYMTMPEVGGIKVPKDSSVLQIRVYGFPTDQTKAKEKILADCIVETLTNGRSQGGCPV